jgi:transposase
VIEMSQSSWLVAGIVPGIERHPVKKLEPDAAALLRLLHRWQAEAERSGRKISRIAVAPCSSQGQAFEAGRDGVWLAPHGSSPWAEGSRLRGCDVEAQVIHPNSIAVSREHRRAKTDRLDTGLLKRSFLGGLRGERDHCNMVAIPTLEEEDAKRPGGERDALVSERTRIINRFKSTLAWLGIRGFKPHLRHAAARLETLRTPEGMPLPANTMAELRREIVRLRLIVEQIREIEAGRVERLEQQPGAGAHPMVRALAQIRGVGIETADMLAHEAFSRPLRDQRAVARGACPRAGQRPDPGGGLTGSPDESGARRREKGLARPAPGSEQGAGNARVPHGTSPWAKGPRGMIQLAWRFLMFQKDSALVRWYRQRTAEARGATRKTMIVALARKLLIELWRLATTGQVPEGVVLRSAP